MESVKAVRLIGILLIALAGSGVPLWGQMNLHAFDFNDDRTIEFQMMPTRRVSEAAMKAKVRFQAGQARIEIEYDDLKPAVLFGGDVTSYVLWAVNRDGGAKNLGELWVRPDDDSDTVRFSTGLRNFALLVTAEPYYQVSTPSDFVIFFNDTRADPPIRGTSVIYSDFSPAPDHGVEDLEAVSYASKKPLELVQAEKGFELAGEMGAEAYAPDFYGDASLALEQAQTVFRRGSDRGARQFARKSYAASNDAIRLTQRKKTLEEIEAQVAERRRQMEQMEQRLQQAESQIEEIRQEKETAQTQVQQANRELQEIHQEKTSLESTLAALRDERAQLASTVRELEADRQELQVEKSNLQDRLQTALSEVAETRESARGYIVNLPDILFDVGEATRKPPAVRALAKLAGILLILDDLNLRIEGHTDSTGSPSFNSRLSQRRGDAVFDLLAEEGISVERMTTKGYGSERPVASNDTAQGRQQNRRVEIVIAEGEIAEE